MKKIGIITFHYKNNFGAVLQCYALQSYLNSNGIETEIVDYSPKINNFRAFASFCKHALADIFKRESHLSLLVKFKRQLNKLLFSQIQNAKFNLFRKKFLNLSKHYKVYNNDIDLNSYYALITGSDQIWNSIEGYSKVYFLEPFKSFNGKRISYAACRGVPDFDDDERNYIREALSKYNSISVRDTQTQKFVKTVGGFNSTIVCDPTMLVNFEDLDINIRAIKEEYILVYILGKEIKGGHQQIINKIKKRIGRCKVIACILSEKNPQYFSWVDKHIYTASPEEWINLIKYSKFVYTDSFHGVIFATKFHKPFIAYYTEKDRASRLIDLSKRYNLTQNVISSHDEAVVKKSFDNEFNYIEFDSIYEKNKQKSIDFLLKVIR